MITLLLSNFPFVCWLVALGFTFARYKKSSFGKALTKYMLLFPVGLAGIWGFYFHAFEPAMAAKYIGWANSPFQFEVAVANLGMGAAGVVGFWRGKDFALATILMASCFLWGAALNHIFEIVIQSNYASGNLGTILFTDIAIPSNLWIGYFCWSRSS